MIQKFVYETDDLTALEKVLQAIVPIFFNASCYFYTKDDNSFDNGSFDRTMRRGPFIYEDKSRGPYDSRVMVLDHRKVFGGADELELITTYDNETGAGKDAAAAFAHKQNEKDNPLIPKRKMICLLSDDVVSGDAISEKRAPCSSFSHAITNVLITLETTNREDFFKEFGDGYHEGFRSSDGMIDTGYRLQSAPRGRLYLSMIHFYYGK